MRLERLHSICRAPLSRARRCKSRFALLVLRGPWSKAARAGLPVKRGFPFPSRLGIRVNAVGLWWVSRYKLCAATLSRAPVSDFEEVVNGVMPVSVVFMQISPCKPLISLMKTVRRMRGVLLLQVVDRLTP